MTFAGAPDPVANPKQAYRGCVAPSEQWVKVRMEEL